MIWLLWPWNQWHHWETLATCLIIILTASTAPPPTVSILSSCLSRLVIIQVQECYQKCISHVFSWHVWLSKHRFTRVWQQRIWPRVLLPSDFKWVNRKKQQQQDKTFEVICIPCIEIHFWKVTISSTEVHIKPEKGESRLKRPRGRPPKVSREHSSNIYDNPKKNKHGKPTNAVLLVM